MRNQARRQRGVIAHTLKLPTLARTAAQPYDLLPLVAGGGPRYGALVAGLYWAMLAVLVAVYACTLVGYSMPLGSDDHAKLQSLHAGLGRSLLGLFGLRLLVRLIDKEPPMPPPLVTWQAHAATAVQWALYLFMLAMPLTGWWMLEAAGTPLARNLKDAHEWGAMLGYLLLGLNILASLYWHYTPRGSLPPPRPLPFLH